MEDTWKEKSMFFRYFVCMFSNNFNEVDGEATMILAITVVTMYSFKKAKVIHILNTKRHN